MSRLRATLPLLLLLATGAILLASGALDGLAPRALVQGHGHLETMVATHPWWVRLAFVGALTVVVASGVPGNLLVIMAGGLMFGITQGTVLSLVGLVLGSLLLFLASCYAFGSNRARAPELVERLRHGFATHPVSYTLFLRFAPLFPYGAVTVALAWLRCPLWLFIGASALGGALTLVFETAVGAGLGMAVSQSHASTLGLLLEPHLLIPMGILALLSLLPLVVHRCARRSRRTS